MPNILSHTQNMQNVFIGRALRRVIAPELSAKDFFDQKIYPVFYAHPKYLQWIQNSPLVQNLKKEPAGTPKKLQSLHHKIQQATAPDASIAPGFGAEDLMATTSGQMSDMQLPLRQADWYDAWNGVGCGIGVAGGFCFYLEEDLVLRHLCEGWLHYRGLLADPNHASLGGNQVLTWNGQWLCHVLDPLRPDAGTAPTQVPIANWIKSAKDENGKDKIETVSWTRLIFGLARAFPGRQLNAYICQLGQTNTTVGFVPILLPDARRLMDIYRRLYGQETYTKEFGQAMEIFGEGLSVACEQGCIGFQALKPKDLEKYLPAKAAFSLDSAQRKDLKHYQNTDKIIDHHTFLTWIMALLNQPDLWETSQHFVAQLIAYDEAADKGRTDRRNRIEELLKSSGRRAFISSLTEILESLRPQEDAVRQAIGEMGERVHRMPEANVPYFITLLRFQYAKQISSK